MAIINALGYSDYDFFMENDRGSQVYTVGVKCENFANKKVTGKKIKGKIGVCPLLYF
jgi:hypothetical protein